MSHQQRRTGDQVPADRGGEHEAAGEQVSADRGGEYEAAGEQVPADRGGEHEAAAVPLQFAATVMILDDRPELEVLMLKRNARSVFVGDMWVFPGGAVDPGDATPEADAAVARLTDLEASAVLDVDRGGIAYWVAALRETFEEAGVLLAHPLAGGPLVDLTDPETARRFAAHRDWVNTHEGDFVEVVSDEELVLDGGGVHYVARWVTPVGPPRRYDTRFFVTSMPSGQTPVADDDEAVDHEWFGARDALAAHDAGEMEMLTPTVSMLQRLARFVSVEQAVEAAAGAPVDGSRDELVRIRPWVEGAGRIAYPEDADYEAASTDIEAGVIRWPI
jgi:8-oxo-dGTP pyrophosphatase MutT (NUDIX family)